MVNNHSDSCLLRGRRAKALRISILFFVFFFAVGFDIDAAASHTISLFATSPPESNIIDDLPESIHIHRSLSPEQILSPGRPRDSSVIVRCRLSDNTYGLFGGSIEKYADSLAATFSYPQSLTFEQIVRTKIFSEQQADSDADMPLVAFGSDRMYVFGSEAAFLKVNDMWIELADIGVETGALYVQSEPADARIFIDGVNINRTTPSIIEGIEAGEHTVEVSVPEYLFSRKKVVVEADSMVSVSFQLISSMDTAYVEGTLRLGVLQLPDPPIDVPFVIDGREIEGNQVTLNEGKHRVEWYGGDRYSSLDTVVEVFLGKVTTFPFNPRRLTGELELIPNPPDARIHIGEELLGYGVQEKTLPTGEYSFTFDRKRYYSQTEQITIYPDDKRQVVVTLTEVPDRDGDGFLDSVDKCSDVYGLYGGCPTPPFFEALRLNAQRILRNMREDPLNLSINSLSFIYRKPTNTRFRHILSYFSDGKNYMNNHKGLSLANSYTVSMRGLIVSVDLGQWNSGLVYEKADTLHVKGESGNRYTILYDSLSGANPRVVLPSTSVSAGLHFITKWFNFGYLLGYRWEDITIYDLIDSQTGQNVSVRFDNDWWIKTCLVETEFSIGEWFSPTLYTTFTLPLGKSPRTGWHSFQTGLRFRFTPSRMRKRTEKYARQNVKGSQEDE
ncbi:MAG: PEGA domain-containing protein [Fibrobacterota bacterium]